MHRVWSSRNTFENRSGGQALQTRWYSFGRMILWCVFHFLKCTIFGNFTHKCIAVEHWTAEPRHLCVQGCSCVQGNTPRPGREQRLTTLQRRGLEHSGYLGLERLGLEDGDPPVCGNKVWLEHSCGCVLVCHQGRVEQCDKLMWPASLKHLLSGPLRGSLHAGQHEMFRNSLRWNEQGDSITQCGTRPSPTCLCLAPRAPPRRRAETSRHVQSRSASLSVRPGQLAMWVPATSLLCTAGFLTLP